MHPIVHTEGDHRGAFVIEQRHGGRAATPRQVASESGDARAAVELVTEPVAFTDWKPLA